MGEQADALLERFVGSLIATAEVVNIYLGDRLGLYGPLAEGWRTSGELATEAGIAERYAREWLEEQAVAGFVEVDDVGAAADARRYRLPAEHAAVLLDRDSPTYLAAYARIFVAAAQQLPALMDAYRSGGGVNWRDFGPDMSEGQEFGNRPTYLSALGEWFESIPDVHGKLSAEGARMADVGCGGGWSSIALAHAYPNLSVDGFDLDEPAVERARRNADLEGVADRVHFHAIDPAEADHGDGYDLVTAFECIHDMPRPVQVLSAMRAMAGGNGAVIVMDENVQPEFTAPGDDLERMMYGFSTLVCLPDGMSHPGSVGTGTVMRASVFEGYATDAGFGTVEVLPIDGGFWRFYRLAG
ncbi:MAG TPA: methyltransferase domain-containing protein [Actinomycetota bacterium]|nr:methyltransferase domain-containing protein [Actinomycetota bacterium]